MWILVCVLLCSWWAQPLSAASVTVTTTAEHDTTLQRLTEHGETVTALVQRHLEATVAKLLDAARQREQADLQEHYRKAPPDKQQAIRDTLGMPRR